MQASRLKKLITLGIIKQQYSNEYRLQRPLNITIERRVIDELKRIDLPTSEKGGILEGIAIDNQKIVIADFHEIPNGSTVGYNYNPNIKLWDSKINEIIARGNLPFAIHTHPLTLGIESYDNKRSIFYLRPSKQDKAIARNGITPYFNFPEAIFTQDPNLENGFGISFFTGYIFPASISQVSQLQWGAIAGGILSILTTNKSLFYVSVGVLLLDFFRRANYTLEPNGNVKISLTA